MTNQATRIVVGVDDDIRIREAIESLVESAGFTSIVFPSAEEFLQSGKVLDAGCLITDVRMGGIDGLELQHIVKSDRPQFPVIFISGHYDEEVRKTAFEGGALAFMYKPFDQGDLLAAVNEAMSNCS